MPVQSIAGPDSEAMWKRAKKQIQKNYPDLKGAGKSDDKSTRSRFFALVMDLYKKFCASSKHNCTPTIKTHPGKQAEGMSDFLGILELKEHAEYR